MKGLPHGAIPLPAGRAAVLRAVCTVPRLTIRSVAAAAGLSPSATYHQLRMLRHQGFVAWGDDFSPRKLSGSMHPTYTAHAPAHGTEPPCQCHTSFAYISPMHGGHCCFQPATQTCHPEAVARWEAERDRRRLMRAGVNTLGQPLHPDAADPVSSEATPPPPKGT